MLSERTISKSRIGYKVPRKLISWMLAFAIVFPPYLVTFSPSVFAGLKEVVKDLGSTVSGESERYAFVGIDPSSGSEVFFFDGNNNIRVTNNNVTDGNAQYDESSNKIVYQSLIKGIWHIFLYDVGTNTTIQLSHDGTNNVSPQISDGQVVWQSWIDGHWEVYFYDGIFSQRLTFNDTPDVEPQVSGGIVVWREYTDAAPNSYEGDVDPSKYEVVLYDALKRQKKKITDNQYADSHVSIEYPYIVWQSFDGNDTEIAVYYLDTGRIAFLTDNEHDDLVPKLKNGKLKWLESSEDTDPEPSNVIEEDGQTKLQAVGTPLPFWWDEPILCPQNKHVCAYVDGEIGEYANRCYVQKNKGVVIHEGSCEGNEEIPTIILLIQPEQDSETESSILDLSTESIDSGQIGTDETPSGSAEFTITLPISEPNQEPDLEEIGTPPPSDSELASPSFTPEETVSPVVSPSQSFDETASSSPQMTEQPEDGTIFSEPGDYENTGSFDESGDLIIEEHVPMSFNDQPEEALTDASLPVIEDAQEPVIFEESAVLEVGENIAETITDTTDAVANVLDAIIPGSDEPEEPSVPEEELLEVSEDSVAMPTPEETVEVMDFPIE
jgi:beta propeller repeat protein